MKLSDKINHVVNLYIKTLHPSLILDPLTSSGVPRKDFWHWTCSRLCKLEKENERLKREVRIKKEALELIRFRTHKEEDKILDKIKKEK